MLSEDELGDDPVAEVRRWLADAEAAGVPEPQAMQLATSAGERPTVRTVLLRGLDERGFLFVTNLESTKGRQLAAQPACALTLVWPALARQVCVTGSAVRVAADELAAYWRTRPRGSRIGAWASPQSRVLRSRAELDALVAEVEARFAGTDDIPVPPHWGGWRVVPDAVELWSGRPSRLHDRFRYRRDSPDAAWVRERLAP